MGKTALLAGGFILKLQNQYQIRFPRLHKEGWIFLLLFFLNFFIFAELGHLLSFEKPHFASVWFPSGLLLATLILDFRLPRILLIFLAAGISNALSDIFFHNHFASLSFLFSIANYVEASLGAFFYLKIVGVDDSFKTLNGFLKFILFCVVIPPMFSAIIGSGSVTNMFGGSFLNNYLAWWASTAAGILIVAPFFIVNTDIWKTGVININFKDIGVGILAFGLLIYLYGSIFIGDLGDFNSVRSFGIFSFFFLPFPCLAWIALRFRFRGASLSSVIVSCFVLWGTTRGTGPFTASSHLVSASLIVFYIGSTTFLSYLIAIAIEQHDQKEKQLQASENLFRSLAQSFGSFVFTLDKDFKFIYANPTFNTYLSEMNLNGIGVNMFELFHPADKKLIKHNLLNATRHSTSCQFKYRLRQKDGEYRWFKMLASPFYDHENSPAGLVASSFDIHELICARQEAENANRAKGEFLANMSHELRTPMNAVVGVADLCLRGPLNTDLREKIGLIKSASDNLMNLINDILDYSKIQSGKFTLNSTSFDFREAIDSVIESFSFAAEQKGINLVCDIAPILPQKFHGDQLRLKQIISNLLSNAIKYTAKGFVELRIDALESDQGNQLRIVVLDSGTGMDLDFQKRLFEPFTQENRTIGVGGPGTGLGLSIVNHLVKLMGGSINLTSSQQQGSEFTILIPWSLDSWQSIKSKTATEAKTKALLICADYRQAVAMQHLLAADHYEADIAVSAFDIEDRLKDTNPIERVFFVAESNSSDVVFTQLRFICEKLPGVSCVLLAAPSMRAALADDPRAKKFLTGSLNLPCSLARLKDIRIIRVSEHTPSTFDRRYTGSKVLVAEDNDANIAIIEMMLKELGVQVEVVRDGEQAIKHATKGRYDLIFMDVQMPKLNGLDATRRIRATESKLKQERVPIVGLTAFATSKDRDVCLNSGMDGYLSKPFVIDQLDLVLGKYLKEENIHRKKAFTINLIDQIRKEKGNEAAATFVSGLMNARNELDDACKAEDFDALQIAAHRIAGFVGYFGNASALETARRLDQLCQHKESVAFANEIQSTTCELSTLIDQIGSEYNFLRH